MPGRRRSHLPRPGLWLGATVAAGALLTLAALSLLGPDRVHGEGEGPLSATSGSGGNALYAPDASPWRATFGAYVLCRTDPDVDIELQQVRAHTVVEPRSVTPTLRILDPEALRLRDGWFARGYEPVLSAKGTPPGFEEPYAEQQRLPGRYSTDIEGYRVADECHHPPVAEGGYTELMLSLEAGRKGAHVDRMYIDYLADGEPRTLSVEWEMILCGRATRASCTG